MHFYDNIYHSIFINEQILQIHKEPSTEKKRHPIDEIGRADCKRRRKRRPKEQEQDSVEVKREMFQRSITSCITLASLHERNFSLSLSPRFSLLSSFLSRLLLRARPGRVSDKHPFINVSVIQLNYPDIDKTRSDGRQTPLRYTPRSRWYL